MPLSYRQLKPIQGPVFQGWYWICVVRLNFSSWSIRNGVEPEANTADGTAPAPPICGVKKRAATLENTASAENPCKLGTLTRPAYPGIFDRSHSTGNVIDRKS